MSSLPPDATSWRDEFRRAAIGRIHLSVEDCTDARKSVESGQILISHLDTRPMLLDLRRVVAGALLAATLIVFAGCAPAPIDSTLWLQLDHQQNVIYEIISDSVLAPTDPHSFADALGDVADSWDGASTPDFIDPAVGATVIYNMAERTDQFNDPVLDFDVFVSSGHRPGAEAGSGGSFTPTSVYTCYRLSVTFVAGIASDPFRSRDSGDDRLDCPQELVEALGGRAQYREPWEFDG